MADILLEAAQNYKMLIDKEYNMVAGKSGKLTSYVLTFEKENFKHLLGVQKLKDTNLASELSARFFDNVIAEKIGIADLQKSKYFAEIAKRVEGVANFEKYLDRFTTVTK